MTRFVVSAYPTEHPGLARLEGAFERLRDLGRHLSGAQALASALLAGMVAAVLVVAHQVMDSLAEGHLLAIWIGAWLVGFAALAALAQPARQLAAVLRQLTRPGAQRATGEAAR
jgi:Flp pilus assembly protein TadB